MNYIDFNNICRSCTVDRNLQPIQDNFVIDVFQKLIDVQYAKTDELPQKICETCIQTIYSIQKFVLQCKTIDLALKKYLSNFKSNANSISSKSEIPLTLDIKDNIILNPMPFKITNIVSNYDSQVEAETMINDSVNETISNECNETNENTTQQLDNNADIEDTDPEEDRIINIEINVESAPDKINNIARNEIVSNAGTSEKTPITTKPKKILNLKRLLTELNKEFSFGEKKDFLNKHLDLISANFSVNTDTENIPDEPIPVSQLFEYDDDILIIDEFSPKRKRIKMESTSPRLPRN